MEPCIGIVEIIRGCEDYKKENKNSKNTLRPTAAFIIHYLKRQMTRFDREWFYHLKT